MQENKPSNNKKKNYNKPNQGKTAEINSAKTSEVNNTEKPVANEFSSYSSRLTYSSYHYYSSLDIFNYCSEEDLKALVKDPMTHNKILRDISLMLYGTNGIFTNTVDYMTAMPTLDKVIVVHGKNKEKRKRNKELMESVLRIIKDKEIIRDALWRGMVSGIAFYYFETVARPDSREKFLTDYDIDSVVEINDLGINASIISLPVDYTKIVGIKNNSYVIAFDLDYFNDFSGEEINRKLRKFPKEIRDAYNSRKNQKGVKGRNWVVLDNSHTIVHKIRSQRSEMWGRPLVLAAISDILYNDYFTSTKHNVLDEINNKVVIQTFPEGRERGMSALTQEQQEKQHNTVKRAVLNKNNRGGTSFISVAAGTQMKSLDVGNPDIFDEKYEGKLDEKIARAMGIASSLLDGSSSGSYSSQENNLELITGQIFQWVEQIVSELNKCISETIIKDKTNWVEAKYLPITFVNKKTMVGFAKDLYLQGSGSISYWAAASGISPDVFFALLDEEQESGVYDKYEPHRTSYTLSAKDQKSAGRPETDDPTDRTIMSNNNGGNNIPSPSDK